MIFYRFLPTRSGGTRYGISADVTQTSFRGETSCNVVKCRLFLRLLLQIGSKTLKLTSTLIFTFVVVVATGKISDFLSIRSNTGKAVNSY